jgi:hypothetical protein
MKQVYVTLKCFRRCWEKGRIRTHPVRVVDGGFEAILEGLKILKRGEVSGEKLVVRLL